MDKDTNIPDKFIKIAQVIIPVIIVIFMILSILLKINSNFVKNERFKKEVPVQLSTKDDLLEYELAKKVKEEDVERQFLKPQQTEVSEAKEPALPEGTDRFIVTPNLSNEVIAANLLREGYVENENKFILALENDSKGISPGAYKISKEMSEIQLRKILTSNKPYMKWVTIKPGLRKEEIAEILKDALGWSKDQKENWIKKDTAASLEFTEGVFYPDTYLIPVEEEPGLTAKRLISKFNENFEEFLIQFSNKNIKWTKALTLASIVQREASGDSDMSLIAGILWNRLEKNMALGVDATLQYLRGDKGGGWWAPITISDKQIDSPFNTYKYKGLPPHPISNPGIMAIRAVLNPTKTDCLYYIHDKNKNTHCSITYEEHLVNIEQYLKGN